MALVVDKVEKKRNIALSCKGLFVENSFSDITINQIARAANISKGSFYDYYSNKEDVIFELTSILLQENFAKEEKKLKKYISTKDKLKSLFSFFYKPESKDLRTLYLNFTAICLTSNNDSIKKFHTEYTNKYHTWLTKIIDLGVKNNELIPKSINYSRFIENTVNGIFISNVSTYNTCNLKYEINLFIDKLFNLLEVKK